MTRADRVLSIGEFLYVTDGARLKVLPGECQDPTAGIAIGSVRAAEEVLRVASPNPFVAGNAMRFRLGVTGQVRLGIYDVAGRMVRRLVDGQIAELDASDRLYQRVQELGADPLPYGIAPNRTVLEQLLSHAKSQQILSRSVEIETLFATETHNLVG